MTEITMVEISLSRFAELKVIEDKYARLCEVIKDRKWRGLSGDEIRFIQDMLGIKGADEE